MREQFLEGMSRAAATVSIVTTDGPAGRAGVTVSAMTALSADSASPSLVICINDRSSAAGPIRDNGVFCVNVLSDAQSYMADAFAGRVDAVREDKFAAGDWKALRTGSPTLTGALVAFDCVVKQAFQYGSHWLIIGELADVAMNRGGVSLVYANRAYGSPVAFMPTRTADAAHRAETVRAGVLTSLGPFVLPGVIARFIAEQPDVGVEIVEGTQGQVIETLRSGRTDVALTYDFDLPDDLVVTPLASFPPYCLLPESHPLAARSSVLLADLAGEPLVLYDVGTRDFLMRLFADRGLTPAIAYETVSLEMTRGLVANGLGYSILTTKPSNSMSYDGVALATLPLGDAIAGHDLVLVRNRRTGQSAAINAFADRCKASLAAQG